ncbi:MAG TPA: FAD-binding oxidoreductase [Trebonia sp.]|nr:FAD-binding oxidoreductase [Trebonia sp.]
MSSPHSGRLSDQDIAALGEEVSGPVLRPGDESYAAEAATYNLAVPHHPAVIVGAASPADVQAAVRLAAARGLPVAVLATGHQAIMPADGAVLITTSRMAAVSVDPAARTARVGAGTRWQQVVDAATPHGLAPLNGSSPLVGVVGYTLGGGLSPTLGRAYGWAADHVRALEVVTADGALRTVTPTAEPDLFWALRGAKSNFGVVTALEIDLFPVRRLYGGGLFFSGQDAQQVLRAYRDLTQTAPDELATSVALLRLPPLPFVPEPLRGNFTIHVRVSYLGSAEAGAELVAPLRAAAPALIDTLGEMPYARFAEIHSDPVDPAPFLERSAMLAALTPQTLDTLIELAGPDADCPLAFVEMRHLGGALRRPPAVPDAVGNRDAAFAFWIVAIGTPQDGAEMMKYADLMLDRLAPWSTGGKYLNFMSSEDATADKTRPAYTGVDYRRLQAIKAEYDPTNMFRLNHNIPPRA